MKKSFLFLFLLLFTIVSAISQTSVGTDPTPRNAVLEEFTGINCVNCPDGHARALALYNAYPGRVNIINIHEGSYSVPSGGQPDFRTPFGTAIGNFSGRNAYPAGMMNRIVWPGAYNVPPYFPQNPPNNMAIRRPGWWDTGYPGQGAGAYIILNGGLSPVNIGVSSSWDEGTRLLTVNVELYYTATETVDNEINVVFLENGVIGYQSGGGSSYVHNHILRYMLTGQWGDVITAPAMGTLITKTYTYTVPANYNGIIPNIDNCDITVFVTQNDHKTIHTGLTILAKNGSGTTTAIKNDVSNLNNAKVFPNPLTKTSALIFSLKNACNTKIELYNLLGEKISQKELGNLTAGNQTVSLDFIEADKLQQGVYILKIYSGSYTTSLKLIK